jgi:carbon-monoxide dehydrogenase medium subunit
MKKRLVHPSFLLDLKRLQGLHFIREEKDRLTIGALSTLREIETSPLVRQRIGVLGEMIHMIGSVQIRNVGTLAGNLCLADPASDPAPLLIALRANLKVAGPGGKRTILLEEFFSDFYETVLLPEEILEAIEIPFLPQRSGAVYLKHTMREAFDLGVVGVAVRLDLERKDGMCSDVRIVLGGVTSTPARLQKVEALLKEKRIDESLIARTAMTASQEVDPIQDVRASAEYRREMIEVFVERGIKNALERAKGGVS